MPLPSRSLRTSAIAAVALAAVAAAGCGGGGAARAPNGPGSGRPPVVIGSQNFTEQRILGELYAQALRAKGYRVRIRGDLPDRSAAARALTDGRIDGYRLDSQGSLQLGSKTISDPNDPNRGLTLQAPSNDPSSLIWNAGQNLAQTPGTGATNPGARTRGNAGWK